MLFPSEQWLRAWIEACNVDDDFVAAGAGWEGAVGCMIGATSEPGGGAQYFRLDGHDGTWIRYQIGPDPALVAEVVFVLSADLATWKLLIRQELHPIRAMVVGRVRIRGQLSSLLRWSRAIVIMTQIAGRLETTFADEPA